MSHAHLNLVVIRVRDMELAHRFYTALGLSFKKHSHGQGPQHYAAENEGIVFEIYPAMTDAELTSNLRLGFKVKKVAGILAQLEEIGGKLLSPAKLSPWGLRAVIGDPFGHKIELVE